MGAVLALAQYWRVALVAGVVAWGGWGHYQAAQARAETAQARLQAAEIGIAYADMARTEKDRSAAVSAALLRSQAELHTQQDRWRAEAKRYVERLKQSQGKCLDAGGGHYLDRGFVRLWNRQ